MKSLTVFALSFENLKRRPLRTLYLTLIVAVFAFSIFCGSILSQSIKLGISSMSGRIGADIMVAPRGYNTELSNSLLRSEPCEFYMDGKITDGIKKIPGVRQASPQLFIESLNAACCVVPVQIIGYDQATDFTIQPWMLNNMDSPLQFGDVVIGNLVEAEPGDEVLLYGQNFKVAAKLDETGMGFDSSIFMTKETARHMADISSQSALHPVKGEEGMVSSILVKLDADADASEIAGTIVNLYPETDVIVSSDMLRGISSQLENVSSLVYGVSGLLWVISVMVLVIVFSVTMNERLKEFGLLISLGATRKKLVSLIMCESLMTSAAGAVCGVLMASLVIFPFRTLIAASIGLPYLNPSIGSIVLFIVVSLAISVVTGPLSCIHTAVRVSKSEIYTTIRENE